MIRILQYRLKNPQEFVERSKYEAETKEEVEKYKDISEEEMYRFVVHCVKDHLIIIKYVRCLLCYFSIYLKHISIKTVLIPIYHKYNYKKYLL